MFNDVIIDDMVRNIKILMEGKKKFKCVIPYVMDMAEESMFCSWASPLAIDLNNDGIQSISLEKSTSLFDIRGTGEKIKSGWLSPQDGFLAIDLNKNGSIDNIHELFGGHLGDGFMKLEILDTNKDGAINRLDEHFDELLIWQDANSDGTSQQSELYSLSSFAISELSLTYSNDNFTAQNGNIFGEDSTAIINENSVALVDIYFKTTDALQNTLQNPDYDLANSDQSTSQYYQTASSNMINQINLPNTHGNSFNDTPYKISNAEGLCLIKIHPEKLGASSHDSISNYAITQFIQAMNTFSPPVASQSSGGNIQKDNNQMLLALSH